MLPLKNDLVCVLESHIKCTDTAIFACRTPGTRQERRKKKEVKNPNPKRSVLRASLAPKISFLSQSHSLTPISSVSSSSFFSGRSPLPLLLPNMPLHILRFPTFAPLGNWVLWEIRDARPRMTFNFFFFFFERLLYLGGCVI